MLIPLLLFTYTTNLKIKEIKIAKEGQLLKKKNISIEGLTIEEVDQLHILADEQGFDSLNSFMLHSAKQILSNSLVDQYQNTFKTYFTDIEKVENAILEKHKKHEKEFTSILNKLQRYETLISKWLEYEGIAEKEVGI